MTYVQRHLTEILVNDVYFDMVCCAVCVNCSQMIDEPFTWLRPVNNNKQSILVCLLTSTNHKRHDTLNQDSSEVTNISQRWCPRSSHENTHIHNVAHMHSCTHVHTRTHTYTHVHTRTHTYTHVHTRTHTYTHVHTRTHTYTHASMITIR